jgi:hypothetical protein
MEHLQKLENIFEIFRALSKITSNSWRPHLHYISEWNNENGYEDKCAEREQSGALISYVAFPANASG